MILARIPIEIAATADASPRDDTNDKTLQIMRRSLYFVAMAAVALLLHSCTTMYNASSYGYGDLYTTNNRVEVANQLMAEAEAQAAEANARRAQWQAMQAEAAANQAEAEYYASLNGDPSFGSVVATDYESAYARRLYGFQSPTYRMPSSYYDLVTNSALFYATAYDPAFYNVMVSGNQVWVEPKYVTSMFGTWGATNITYGLYASPWNYGWAYVVDPFYYTWWGYPRYSWYDWNWNICYNPYYYDWYWGYYPYYHHHHHGHYPPHYGPGYGPGPRPPHHSPDHGYRPGHTTGPGGVHGYPGGHNLNGNRSNTASRYTSPTTNRNYGSTQRVENGRGGRDYYSGSTSSGIYTGRDSRTATGSINTSTNVNNYTRANTNMQVTTQGNNSTSGRGNNNATVNTNTTTKRGENYRQGGTTSRSGNSSVGSSSNNRSSSSYRSGSSTSSSRSSSSSYRSSGSSSSSRSGGFSSGSSSRSGGGSTSSRR